MCHGTDDRVGLSYVWIAARPHKSVNLPRGTMKRPSTPLEFLLIFPHTPSHVIGRVMAEQHSESLGVAWSTPPRAAVRGSWQRRATYRSTTETNTDRTSTRKTPRYQPRLASHKAHSPTIREVKLRANGFSYRSRDPSEDA